MAPRRSPFDRLLQAAHHPTMLEALRRTLTPGGAARLGADALASLHCCLDPSDASRARTLVAALDVLGEDAALPPGEPAATLRVLAALGGAVSLPPTPDDARHLGAERSVAEAAFDRADWPEARRLLSHLLAASRDSGDRILALRLLACVHHNRGEFEQEAAILAVGAVALGVGPTDGAHLLLARGNALKELRRERDAVACYHEAWWLARRTEPPDTSLMSGILICWANARQALMDRTDPRCWRRLRRSYERAHRSIVPDAGQMHGGAGVLADRLIDIAWTYLQEAHLVAEPACRSLAERCAELATEALAHNERGPAEQPARRGAHILSIRAAAHEVLGDRRRAGSDHRAAVIRADTEPDRMDIRWDARTGYALFCARQALWTTGDRVARQAHRLSEQERRRRELRDGRTGLARSNARIYSVLVDLELGRRGVDGARPADVFRWIELAKARAALDGVAGGVQDGRYLKSVATPVRLDDLLARLPAEGWLVEYFVIADRLLALVVSTRGSGLVEIPGGARETLEEASAFHRHLRSGRFPRQKDLSSLARVMSPVLQRIGTRPELLVVVPHGSLHGVPFHALLSDDTYLLQRTRVVYGPSASVLARVSRRTRGLSPFLGVGVGDDLPGAVTEVAAVAASHADLGLRLLPSLIGHGATAERVLALAPRAGTIHLACHAVSDAAVPEDSHLILHDRPLTVREVTAGPALRARQVVMNACWSGVADVDVGEEHVGFVTAFLQAGAATVVGALWESMDRVTPRLTAQYYRHMVAGASPSTALRLAQLSFLDASEPAFRDPMFWAPFFVAGAW